MKTSHRRWSTSQKYLQNPLVSSRTFFVCQQNFFCPLYSLLLMSNNNLSFFFHSGIPQGVVIFPKICRKFSSLQPNFFCLLVVLFFVCQTYFFCPIYSFLLMSNKNLSFLPFKPPIGGGQLPKNVCKILQSLAELFLAASRPIELNHRIYSINCYEIQQNQPIIKTQAAILLNCLMEKHRFLLLKSLINAWTLGNENPRGIHVPEY